MLLPQLRFSADCLTNNLNNQWNLNLYEVCKPRSTEDTSQQWLGDFIGRRENTLCVTPATMERLARIHSFEAPSPTRAVKPLTWAGNELGRYMKLRRSKLNTNNKQHSYSTKCQPGESQRERGTVSPKRIRVHT